MSGALVPYNISLPAASGPWIYSPFRDGLAATGWNASFTGNDTWPHWPSDNAAGSGTFYFRTHLETAKIELDFTGTGLVLCVTGNGATYTLSVDGRIVRDTGARDDTACVNYGSDATIISSGLELGRHTAELRLVATSEDHEFRFWGGLIMTSVAVGSSSEKVAERMIDDRSADWAMAPGRGSNKWDYSTNSANFEQTSSFNCIYGPSQTASYTFRGASAVVLHGGLYEDTHDYAVILDGRTVNFDASVSGWAAGAVPVFVESNLDPDAQHTITLRNYSEDNIDCNNNGTKIKGNRGCCMNLDALQLIGSESTLETISASSTLGSKTAPTRATQTQAGPSSSVTSSVLPEPQPPHHQSNINASSRGLIAGGIMGGIFGGLVIAAAVFFVIRRLRAWHDAATGLVDLPNGAIASSTVRPYQPPPPVSVENPKSSRYFYRQAMIEKGGSDAGGAASLRTEDMERMLEYVASQLNRHGRASGGITADSLPSYRR